MPNSEVSPDEDTVDPNAECFAELASGIYRHYKTETVTRGFRYAVEHELFAKNPTIMLMFCAHR